MNGKVAGRAAGATSNVNDSNSNQTNRGSDMAPEAQPNARNPRATRKAAMFGKRSNSMRRNAKAEVTKQGWLYKQASSGVKQWNKRWFVLADRCLFYYKDEKEDTVLGSLPLLSFRVGAVQVLDNVTRRFSFKVWQVRAEGDEEGDRDEGASKVPLVFCVQAEHAGTRTYYFSADSPQEQEEWIRAMGDAAQVAAPPAQRPSPESSPPATEPPRPVPTAPETRPEHPPQTLHPPHRDAQLPPHPKVNGTAAAGTPSPSTPRPDREGRASDARREGGGRAEVQGGGEDDCGPAGGRSPGALPAHLARPSQQSNGWSHEGPPPPNGPARPHVSRQPAPRAPGDPWRPPQGPGGDGAGGPPDPRELQESSVLRRGCLARTDPERLAQRKSSMTQLQRWVNQRRGPAYEELSSPTRYYTVNRGVSADVYGVYGGPPQYGDEYPPLYPPGARPESICSGVSGVGGGYDRRWTPEERRRSLRDGPQAAHYGPPLARDPWGPQYYGGGDPLDPMGAAMKRLSIQPRSRSVPRSPSSSCGGPYSPGPHSFVSPARSPSTCYNPGTPRRLREEALYADPSVYRLRRSLSSPKYDYPGDRRSLNQGLYYYNNYPPSPSIHSKMEEMLELQLQRNLEYLDQQGHPFHDVYSRELHPTLKLNEIETSKLLGRLCEQNRILKDQEAVVHRLRMEKDTLEGALVATHQEMELYHSQPLIMDNLQYKKESLQNQLINIRGELSQASSSLTTLRMEFEALEDEANAIHGDLWEQLNAGGQSELVHRHIQKEFWRVQDVLEGLHKSNSSRGTDTSKHRAASGVSGSYSTTSPASPMSSVGLTSPLSPFSPLPASQPSPTKPPGPEDVGPPRPPLPASYCPLESSPPSPPSVPPLPFDSAAWLRSLGLDASALDEDSQHRKPKYGERSSKKDVQDQNEEQERQAGMNKVGIVPPRSRSPTDEAQNVDGVFRRHRKASNGISRERPKSAVFPTEIRSKMSAEEQMERLRRNQSSSVRDKRRSLNLAGQTAGSYRVVRRRLTAHEVDIKDLEAAVRGEGLESPREEIARLRRVRLEPDHYELDHSRELLAPDKVLIPERYLDLEVSAPLSPEEQREKQKKVERIKTLIAKSSLQNVVPLLDGPTEGGHSEQHLQEQEKRIEISCALAAEASRRSRLLSAQCVPSPPTSPTRLVPPPSSADLPASAHIMSV
ncbi:pleckstrin homology domain-containing family A member 6 isoform X4 [Gadus morhua]|nr:pleckstrin homology domain-containing family A member 6 isoform X4 [Gadus morhua]XP_030229752.1 pleckstrin homology domain-containing family A member 6 isoform X4 [Gadus morhua]XP_030229758.1 pleckstrin homology domain-containing family A member 6 isoform X4 [Gadus morhua]XP_030229760.1 pleckstrin homology domain-containing family A member 6 isoform X4 [Gadus morhua]